MAAVTDNKAPEVLGVIISMLALGGTFIFARTYTRTLIKPAFGLDDILIIITWFIILGYAIAMFVAVHRGYGRPLPSMSMEQYSRLVHAEIIGQVFAIASFPTGKASIAVFLTRLFPGKILLWSVWILVALNACFFYIDAILIVVQCTPAAYQWDRTIKGGSCWNPKIVTDFGIATGAVGALADFVFAIIPWFYIWNLKMATRERIVVGVALSLGFFAGICSILKIYYTGTLTSRSDYAYDTIPLVQWSCIELAFINVAACIPTLRPLYRAIRGEKDNTPKGSAYANGSNAFPRRRAGLSELESGSHDRNVYTMKTYGYTYEPRTASPPHIRNEVSGGRGSDDARLIP